MKRFAILIALIATLGVTSTLHDYKVPIAKAMSACASSLGSVHFEGAQAYVLPSRGVDMEMTTGTHAGDQGIIFKNQGGSSTATFSVNSKRRQVNVKHMHMLVPGRMMCVLPD